MWCKQSLVCESGGGDRALDALEASGNTADSRLEHMTRRGGRQRGAGGGGRAGGWEVPE